MPLGKYYCDYCDKQFQDTYFARKRHLQGIQHLRAKALWYDSLNGQYSPPPPSLFFLFLIIFIKYAWIYNIILFLACAFLIAETNQTYPDGFPKGVCSRFVKTVLFFFGENYPLCCFLFSFCWIVLHMGFGLKGFCPFGDSCKYLHPKNNPAQNTGNQGLRGIFLPLHFIVCCWCRWYLCSSSLMYYFSRHFLELFFAMHFSYQLLDLRILMLGHHRLIKGFI